MNKRQLKKRNKKCLPVIADESILLIMTTEENKQAIKDMQSYRLKYGYRKKYKDLKGKYLSYCYPVGKATADYLNRMIRLARGKTPTSIVIQNFDEIEKSIEKSYDS